MADLRGTQLKNGFQTLVTIGSISETEPTNGALTNGKDQGITQVTLGLGSASAPSYSFTGDTNTGLFASGADAIGLVTGGTSRLAIDSSGNINIGGTTTIAKNVSGTFEGLVLNNSRGTQDEVGHVSKLSFQHNSVNASEIRSVNTEDFTTSAKQSADLTFHTILDGTLSEKVRINDDGKVGIGTDSPDTIMEIKGADPVLTIRDSSTSVSDGNATIILGETGSSDDLNRHVRLALRGTSSGPTMAFDIDTNEKMRIDENGNVGIGTTSPSQRLEVHDASSTTTSNDGGVGIVIKNTNNTDNNQGSLEFQNSAGTKTASIISTYIDHSTDEGALSFAVGDGGGSFGEAMRITANKRIGIGTTSPENNLHIAGTTTVAMTLQAPTHSSSVASTATMNFKYQSSGGAAIGKIELVEKQLTVLMVSLYLGYLIAAVVKPQEMY